MAKETKKKYKVRKGFSFHIGEKGRYSPGDVIELTDEELKGQDWKVEEVTEGKALNSPEVNKMQKPKKTKEGKPKKDKTKDKPKDKPKDKKNDKGGKPGVADKINK